jgi:hypothetical protein
MERSKAYYSSAAGKRKKKLHNGKRRKHEAKPDLAGEAEERGTKPQAPGIEFDAGIVEYVRGVTSLIEGRRVSQEEILKMLRRTMRQHSLGRERRIHYVVRTLKEKPP